MTARTIIVAVAACSVVGLVIGANDVREERVGLDDLPPAVRATVLQQAAGAPITEIERETRNGATVYEAEFKLNGDEVEISVAADGRLLSREVEHEHHEVGKLTLNALPVPARAALRRLAGDATLIKVERETEHGVTCFEGEWAANGTRHEAAVLVDGTVLEIEETVPAEQAPAGVREAIARHFGAGRVVVEKKMVVVYEIEGRIDGRAAELLVLPTGQVIEEHDGDEHDGDEHDGDEHDGDDEEHDDEDDDESGEDDDDE